MDEIVTPVASRQELSRVEFTGRDGDFRRLVTFGALLEVVTFGFYRFWLTTNIRRHLWTNTSTDGDALEYTGRGVELLIGFLFALAILLPFYLLYFFVSIEAERYKAFASFPLFLIFYFFTQFAVFRARRYRLTRTLWRGVRFWMTGSGIAYAFRAFGWQILNSVTLGLAYPWSVASLERYKMSHSHYGNLQGEFTGKGWEFFKRGWWIWLLAWIPAAAYIGAIVLVSITAAKLKTQGGDAQRLGPMIGGVSFLASLVLLVTLPFIFGAFRAIEWKWWLQSIRFGDVHLDSSLPRGALIGNYWKLIGISLLVLLIWVVVVIVVGIAGGVALQASGFDFNSINVQVSKGHFSPIIIAAIGAYVLWYLSLILALGVVFRIYLFQRIWKIVASSVTIHNLAAASHVMAAGEAASALGEGLADGLDVAGF